MGTPFYHTQESALSAVWHYGEIQGIEDFMAILTDMEACYDDLDSEDRAAYNFIMRTGVDK